MIANPGKQLWMDINDLAEYDVTISQVKVTVAVLNVRANPVRPPFPSPE